MSSEEKKLWKIQIPVLATGSEIEAVTDALGRALCPDDDHAGSCPVPWFIVVTDGDSLDRQERLDLEELLHTPDDHGPGEGG
ncbi:hypothetical protein OG559_00460 [Micromonospora sp. NBC_01405]|uniref:hypothetical protein n=1 Tax=Micromonospora sp. NBC_01405 TaxID=2903589 RepID=UPI00324D8DE2